MKKQYVDAVTQLLQSGVSVTVVLEGLKRALESKGYTSLHAQILKGVEGELEKANITTVSQITVAKESDVALHTQAIQASLAKIGGTLEGALITTDSTLIGGYMATHMGKNIDASHKEKLVRLYRSITA